VSAPGQREKHLQRLSESSPVNLNNPAFLDFLRLETVCSVWDALPLQARKAIFAIVVCFPEAVEVWRQVTQDFCYPYSPPSDSEIPF
jgi:hypothetical protein